jgi:putative tryptophan/tyrosine transport system substrate-binding protein
MRPPKAEGMGMKRREFLGVLGGAAVAWPVVAWAQQRYRIGLLNTGSSSPLIDTFVNALGDLGYVEGKNVVIERRFAEGNANRLQEFAMGLVRLPVDVIVTMGTPAGFAAKQATTTIPLVFAANSDPVGVGLVASLARPGGNATGNSLMAPELSAKRLEILETVGPQISRVAILWDSSNPGMAARVHETEIAAGEAHILLRNVGPRNLEELEVAFAELARQRPDALLVTTETFTRLHLRRILDFANANRLPAMYEDSTYVEAGGLMSYGPDYRALFRRAAALVDKILKGTKPADLPIEQPTVFELVVNLNAAKMIGLDLPPSLLARADKVIE